VVGYGISLWKQDDIIYVEKKRTNILLLDFVRPKPLPMIAAGWQHAVWQQGCAKRSKIKLSGGDAF